MRNEDREKIKKIMAEIQCKKNFACVEKGFKNLCKAEDIGIDTFIKCLDKQSLACSFAVPFGDANFCKCPLRVYLCKRVGK